MRWAVDLNDWDPDHSEWESLLRRLPADVAAEVIRFKQAADQKRALVSRLLQRKVVSDLFSLTLLDVTISRINGGKPYCSNILDRSLAPNFNFNVSHEGDYAVLAAEPLCICGIDVAALVQARSPRLQSLPDLEQAFDQQLTWSEWDTVESAGDITAQLQMFQNFWSLKEAFVKARGDGLGFELGQAEFRLSSLHQGLEHATVIVRGKALTRGKFYVHKLGKGHIVSVALRPPEDVVDA